MCFSSLSNMYFALYVNHFTKVKLVSHLGETFHMCRFLHVISSCFAHRTSDYGMQAMR